MAQQTPLYEQHVLCGARMVDFHGWMMPLHYGSQIDEHHAVRTDAGMFDVSHMTIVDLRGSRTREFLRYLLANDVAKLKTPGKALYTGMLNASGGVIDDLIVYYFTEDFFRLVVNSDCGAGAKRPGESRVSVQRRAAQSNRRHEAVLRRAGGGSVYRHHRLHR